MRCTSIEHNPQTGGLASLIGSTLSPGSMRKSRYSPKFEDNEIVKFNGGSGALSCIFKNTKTDSTLSTFNFKLKKQSVFLQI